MPARRRPVRGVLSVLVAALLTAGLVLVGSPATAQPCTQTDPIELRYCEIGGAASVVGTPVGAPYPVGAGRVQDYTRGLIAWTSATGAHEVYGAVVIRYRQLDGPRGFLGFPLTGETGTSDGVGRFNHFQRGSIFWTPVTGAQEIYGAIRQKWAELGSERSILGYPITGEFSVNGGRQNSFQGGFLRWTSATGNVRLAVLEPYEHAGTWVTRFRFSREYAGTNPPITPAHVDAMAGAGVRVLYLQAAADDPRYPGLLSPDLLGQFLVRAHDRGMQVVAWYLPHFTNVPADLARLRAMAAFRAGGHAFDAIGVDIEDRSVTDVDARNAALVSLSSQTAAALPDVTLSAIVLPPVVTDVISPSYWPRFPWRQLAPYYQVWQPMAYWSNRTDPTYSDAYRYTSENITRLRANLGEPCAAVSTIGGFGTTETADDYAAMARAARDQGAVGVSIFDWTTTPSAVWPAVRGYDVRGPC